MILEESLAGSPLVQIVWQRLHYVPISCIAPVTHTKASHLRRAPPTAYGAAGMVSPSYRSGSRRRRRSSSSSNNSSNSSGRSTQQKLLLLLLLLPLQLQQQQLHSGRGSGSGNNNSSEGDLTSPAILLPYLPKPRSIAAAVGFAFPLTTQTRSPINTT